MDRNVAAPHPEREAQGTASAGELSAELTDAVTSMLEPLAVMRAVRDEAGNIIDFVGEFINKAGIDALLLPVASLVHARLLEILPDQERGLFEKYKEVTETGVTYIGHEVEYGPSEDSASGAPRILNIRASKAGDGFAVSWTDVTEHVNARHRLLDLNHSLQLSQQIVEGAVEGIWVFDETNQTTYLNAAMAAMLGTSAAEMLGTNILEYLGSTCHDVSSAQFMRFIERAGRALEVQLVNKAGQKIWVRMTTSPLGSFDGEVHGGFALVTDITEEIKNVREREIAESMFARATENAPIGQAIVSLDGTFIEVNAALCQITGFSKEQLTTMTFQEITHPDDLDKDVEQAIAVASNAISSYTMAKRYIRSDGRVVWVELHVSATHDSEGNPVHYISQMIDIDKERKAEATANNAMQRLAYRSTHDALTGLPNRSKFLAVLNRTMHTANDDSITVLFIDIDHFKRINDGISHSSGDAILVEVGRRLRHCIRKDDLVGRLGGDEFAVISADALSADEAMQLAERIRIAIAERPFDTGGSRIHVSISVGVARSTPDTSPQEVLSRADAALHLAKSRGRNCCELADVELIEGALARLQLIDQLHEGIAAGEFHPWFQPIIDLASGSVVGHEVLARWVQRDRVLAAGSFIDAAEDSGLVNQIGRKIISDAIEVYAVQGRGGFLALNASPVQLRVPGFAELMLTELAAGGIDTTRVAVEITEQSLLVNESTIISNLREFHDHKIGLYVDDFGTGYSSITTLRDYPIAGIKLDKSFSQLLSKDPYGSIADLVSGLSELASHLRLDRVAEGIEDPVCAQRLKELGWVRGQGFLYGHAEPFTTDAGLPSSSIPVQRPHAGPDPAMASAASTGNRKRRARDRSA